MMKKQIAGHGLNIMSLSNRDLIAFESMLKRYHVMGSSHVEITARRLDMIVAGSINQHYALSVGELLKKHNMKATLHANHALNFMDIPNLEMHKAVATASIELAGLMDIDSIVIHSGRVPKDVWENSSKELLNAEIETLKMLGDKAGRVGTRIALENLIAKPNGPSVLYGANPRALRDQIENIANPYIGGCLDFAHAFISAPVLGFEFIDAISDFSECVWHLHLHDNCGIPGASTELDHGDSVALGIGDLHLPMGLGRIPWRDVLPRMRFRDETYAMVELHGRYRSDEASVIETAKAFSDYWNGTLNVESATSSVLEHKDKQ